MPVTACRIAPDLAWLPRAPRASRPPRPNLAPGVPRFVCVNVRDAQLLSFPHILVGDDLDAADARCSRAVGRARVVEGGRLQSRPLTTALGQGVPPPRSFRAQSRLPLQSGAARVPSCAEGPIVTGSSPGGGGDPGPHAVGVPPFHIGAASDFTSPSKAGFSAYRTARFSSSKRSTLAVGFPNLRSGANFRRAPQRWAWGAVPFEPSNRCELRHSWLQ
eukprot:scaffold14391_cov116-Isochrysis_galbana.AAC.2